jgi:hypothetical protein
LPPGDPTMHCEIARKLEMINIHIGLIMVNIYIVYINVPS